MKQQLSKIAILVFILGHLLSCDAVKRVAEDEYLLTNNTVIIDGKKDKTETITNLLYQEPNSRIPIIGTPLRLHIYNLARPNIDSILNAKIYSNPDKVAWRTKLLSRKQLDKSVESSKGFNNWLKKTGEAPVIVNDDKTRKSVKRLQDYHINNGWFDVKTTFDVAKQENKRASIEYNVERGTPFILDTITESIKSPVVDSLYNNFKKNGLLKQNEQYRTTNFEQERERISTELRNSGVYHFNQDYISFEIDTIGTNKKVNVDILIQDRAIRTQDSTRREPFNIYKIKDVNIITDDSFENKNKTFQDSIFYNGYKIYSYDKIKYRPKALTDAVFINPGSVFKDSDRTLTYRDLNELRTFKYPNIDYIENPDNTLTDTIRLTPLKKFSLGFSADVSQSNIQTVGLSLNPSLSIRNVFRGAETLQLSAIGSIGSSKDANKDVNDPFFDINEIGVDLKLTIPRFFFPFNTEKIIPKYMSPSTRISLSTTSQTNIGLDKQTFSGVFNYKWLPSKSVTNDLDLFNIQYILNKNTIKYYDIYPSSYNTLNNIASTYNTDADYVDDAGNLIKTEISDGFSGADLFALNVLLGGTALNSADAEFQTVNNILTRKNRLTQNNLILSSSYGFLADNRKSLTDKNFSIVKGKIELAGNLLRALSTTFNLPKNEDNQYELFNVPYSQYIKTDLTYIKYFPLSNKNTIAFRSFVGLGIPLGNATSMPFSKSYFSGGANDNRAWKPYELGPGDSNNFNDFNEANFKLAFNVEHRFNIFESFNGAVFIDAGNIWNVGDFGKEYDLFFNENTTFTGLKSLKNIAVGSGFGLRYDFNFFVFRFDVGFKTYDPSYQDQNRWFNDYNFANAVYNIGINYPF